MNWLLNMRTGRKLAFGFGTCILLTVVIAVFPLTRMTQVNTLMGSVVTGPLVRLHMLEEMYHCMSAVRMRQMKCVVSTVAINLDSDPTIAKYKLRMKSLQDQYGAFSLAPNERQRLEKLCSDWQTYEAMTAKFNGFLSAGKQTDANKYFLDRMRVYYSAVNNDVLALDDPIIEQIGGTQARAAGIYSATTKFELGLLFWVIAIGIVFSTTISRHIAGSLNQVSERLANLRDKTITPFVAALQALEHGDLTARITTNTDMVDVKTKDDIGDMARTVNGMLGHINSAIESYRESQAALSELVKGLQSSAAQVSGAAMTLSSSAQYVGETATTIASSMDEVSRASEQSSRGAAEVARGSTTQAQALAQGNGLIRSLTEAVHGVAQDADSAVAATLRADDVAKAGGDAVKQTVDGMSRIQATVSRSADVIGSLGEASAQIGAIVGTIEEIADQTNLLALNAAIEAARAGDAGRGFAVVADEVRKLAERSRAATQEIGDLIGKVQSHTQAAVDSMQAGTTEVESGTALAEEAGRALAQIQAVVSDVSDQVGRIRSASAEILVSSENVLGAISDVAAIVEESSAAAEEMSASATQVSSSVQNVAGTVAQQTVAVDGLVSASVELSSVAQNVDRMASQFQVAESSVPEQSVRLRRAA